MKGIYSLIIELKKDISIKVGALGKINFKKGTYAYIGSAQNNLEARVKRHLSNNKKIHWHIDYFLLNKHTKVIKVLYKNSTKECKLAKEFSKNNLAIEKFGCSDCKCSSHLFKIKRIPKINLLNLSL